MGGTDKGLADFHFHSHYSDGSENIAGIIAEAKARGVKALSLTDHNTEKGVKEFTKACKIAGIKAFEGTEIYAAFPQTSWSMDYNFCGPIPDVTILGRELDWNEFKPYKDMLFNYWLKVWVPSSLEKMRSAGFKVPNLTKDEIGKQLKDYAVPPVFHETIKNPENWPRLLEICQEFERNIIMPDIEKNPVRWANKHLFAVGKAAYEFRGPREFGVMEAVDLATDMGGVLFAAHPGGEYANWTTQHLDYFIQCGGEGIEVWQYFHTSEQINLFLQYAVRYNLLVSGGSDWHGKNGRQTLGCWDKPEVQTPSWVTDHLFEKLP